MLFASTLEGFGMPIVEAQMVGLPVITSDINPMREVAGEGALLCNPLDTKDIRNCILNLLKSGEKRRRIVTQGFNNSARFQPLAASQTHHEVYTNLSHSLSAD